MNFPTALARATLSIAIAIAPTPILAAAPNADVAQVERHLAASQSMAASFVQTDAKGHQISGKLTLKRPGRVRFEYGSDARMLLVADGTNLYFLDYDVGQKNRWPIAKSPLGPLLSASPDLQRIARPVPVQDPRVVMLRVRDSGRPQFGTLFLAFVRQPSAPGGLQLEGWTAVDAQNKKTTVKLDGQRYNIAVADDAFRFAEPQKRRRG